MAKEARKVVEPTKILIVNFLLLWLPKEDVCDAKTKEK